MDRAETVLGMRRDPVAPTWDPKVGGRPRAPSSLPQQRGVAAGEQSAEGASCRASCTQEQILPLLTAGEQQLPPSSPSSPPPSHNADQRAPPVQHSLLHSSKMPEISLPPLPVSGRKGGSPYPSVGNQTPSSLQHSFPGQGSKALFSMRSLAEQLGMDGRKLGRTLKTALWSRNPHAPLPWVILAIEAVWEEAVHFSYIQPCQ